jgi:hypothetical protein
MELLTYGYAPLEKSAVLEAHLDIFFEGPLNFSYALL